MNVSVLLINCYKDPGDERVAGYREWLAQQFDVTTIHVSELDPAGVTQDVAATTGSLSMLTADDIPDVLRTFFTETTRPVLAVCYGHQALALAWGAKVVHKKFIERNEIVRVIKSEAILENLGLFFTAWESHAEHLVKNTKLTRNFDVLAYSDSCRVEVIKHKERPLWGVQFHPEKSPVVGKQLARNFARIAVKAREGYFL